MQRPSPLELLVLLGSTMDQDVEESVRGDAQYSGHLRSQQLGSFSTDHQRAFIRVGWAKLTDSKYTMGQTPWKLLLAPTAGASAILCGLVPKHTQRSKGNTHFWTRQFCPSPVGWDSAVGPSRRPGRLRVRSCNAPRQRRKLRLAGPAGASARGVPLRTWPRP